MEDACLLIFKCKKKIYYLVILILGIKETA